MWVPEVCPGSSGVQQNGPPSTPRHYPRGPWPIPGPSFVSTRRHGPLVGMRVSDQAAELRRADVATGISPNLLGPLWRFPKLTNFALGNRGCTGREQGGRGRRTSSSIVRAYTQDQGIRGGCGWGMGASLEECPLRSSRFQEGGLHLAVVEDGEQGGLGAGSRTLYRPSQIGDGDQSGPHSEWQSGLCRLHYACTCKAR